MIRLILSSLVYLAVAGTAFNPFSALALKPSESPVSGLINPHAVEFNPATGKVYTVDPIHNSITIVDDVTGSISHVAVGGEPIAITVDSKTGLAFVANSGDGTVSVLDCQTDKIKVTIKVGIHPYSIAANSRSGKVYVSHTFNDDLTVINETTNAITNLKLGSSDLIAINEKANLIYLLGYEGGSVKILDGQTNTATNETVGMHAWGMALDDKTGVLYVTRPGYNQLAVLTTSSEIPAMISTQAVPCAVALNTATGMLYVVNYGANSLSVIDPSKRLATATISVGTGPEAIAIDSVRNRIYVANTHSDSVTVINSDTNRVLATIPAGRNPYALALNSTTGMLHVANFGEHNATVVDPSTIVESTH